LATVFDHQDEEYLLWIEANSHGYVVNAYRNLHPTYLMLHRAVCTTISGTPARGSTWSNGEFIKICADSLADIENWVNRETRGALRPCRRCNPV
jgi:hypothetical protein